jgi:hypothetical protein
MTFVRIARRRTVKIRAGPQILIAAHPHPATLTEPSPRSTQPTVRTNLAEVGPEMFGPRGIRQNPPKLS